MQTKHNLTGERIGKLTVITLAKPNKLRCKHQRRWVCLCECGRKEEILQFKLVGDSPPMACSYCRATISHHLDAANLGAEYTEDETEFIKAVDEYKGRTGRRFPLLTELLKILVDTLGYQKPKLRGGTAATKNRKWHHDFKRITING